MRAQGLPTGRGARGTPALSGTRQSRDGGTRQSGDGGTRQSGEGGTRQSGEGGRPAGALTARQAAEMLVESRKSRNQP